MTNGPKINTNSSGTALKPVILVAPLEWGLGHATRCIPIIRALLQHGADVILAGEGKIKSLLSSEFPLLPFVELKGYRIRYSNNKWTLPFVLASQIPKILSSIQYENKRLHNLVDIHRINAVISDNRYGLYNKKLTNIFITHQLMIRTGSAWLDKMLQKINYKYIDQFTECWIPDHEYSEGLAAALSHPGDLPHIPVQYLGPLSRFDASTSRSHQQHLLILLSGPEPQRTIFENKMIEQIKEHDGPVVFVRGVPGQQELQMKMSHVRFFNHVGSNQLKEMMLAASCVICRSGYSSVMDIAALGLKSILVPTPGQTEQEYLGASLMEKNFALCIRQNKFRLKAALDLSKTFPYRTSEFQFPSRLDDVIKDLLSKIPITQ